MTETEARRFRKHVAIKEVDEEERTATGAVLVPWEVDRQGDFLRPSGIEAMFNPSTDDGVMHARFPTDAAEFVETKIATEPITLGGDEYPAGTWYATRKYHDDDLWSLVKDGVLGGFSIGGEVSESNTYENADDMPDEVTFPEPVDADSFDEYTEIVNGFTTEVSDVDIPAVPRAVFATAKSLEKNIVEDLDSREEFVDVFEDRGHSEDDAGRLFDVLESFEEKGVDKSAALAKLDIGGTTSNGTESYEMKNKDATDVGDLDSEDVGFIKWLRSKVGGSDADDDVEEKLGDLERAFEDGSAAFAKASDVLKEGRPLNESNRTALMAAHDAIEAALESDLDDKTFETNRFTDDSRFEFDLTAYSDKAATVDVEKEDGGDDAVEKLTQDQGEHVVSALDAFVDSQGLATFGEFKEWVWMSHEDLDDEVLFATEQAIDEYRRWTQAQRANAAITEEFGTWLEDEANTDLTMADSLNEKLDELEEKLDEYEKRIDEVAGDDGDVDKNTDADADQGGDVDKNTDDVDDDVAEKLESITEKVDSLDERVDSISHATADTQQLGKAASENEEPRGNEKTVWTR